MMKFSIITCAYNPNEIIFNMLIKALAQLIIPEQVVLEWVVVDNNSSENIEQAFDFSKIEGKIVLKHVVETKPGLTAARIAGAKQAKGGWLIFFDDDNEPQSDFIMELQKGMKKYPEVNCWGPGQIAVKYIGEVSKWYLDNKHYYQERKEKTKFGNEKFMQSYYPIGTGLCIERASMLDYIAKVENGTYSVTDRTGSSLVSGGDTQIVLNNQLLGNYAGKLEALQLNHCIESRKANFQYLIKQKYWTASSYKLVLKQVYPDFKVHNVKEFNFKSVMALIKRFYYEIKVNRKDFKQAYLCVCNMLGESNANFIAGFIKKNALFQKVEKLLIS